MENVTTNQREQQRVMVLTQVVSGGMTVAEAAVQMGGKRATDEAVTGVLSLCHPHACMSVVCVSRRRRPGCGNREGSQRAWQHHDPYPQNVASKFFAMDVSVPELSRNRVIISYCGPSHTPCTMVIAPLRGCPCPVQPEELWLNPNAAACVPEAETVDLDGLL